MAQSTAAIRGACRGPPAPGSCSAITSPLFLSYAAPVGVLAVAWRGAATVVLTCYPPAGDSPSPPSAPGNPAASPPSCGPRTSTCLAARPAPGDTEGTGSVRGCPAWPPRPHPHGLPGWSNWELLGRVVFPTLGLLQRAPQHPKGDSHRSQEPRVPCHAPAPAHPFIHPPSRRHPGSAKRPHASDRPP